MLQPLAWKTFGRINFCDGREKAQNRDSESPKCGLRIMRSPLRSHLNSSEQVLHKVWWAKNPAWWMKGPERLFLESETYQEPKFHSSNYVRREYLQNVYVPSKLVGTGRWQCSKQATSGLERWLHGEKYALLWKWTGLSSQHPCRAAQSIL